MATRKLTPDQITELVQMRANGTTMLKLALHFDIAPATAFRYARKHGAESPTQERGSLSEGIRKQIIALREAGKSVDQIAVKLSQRPNTIRSFLLTHMIETDEQLYRLGRAIGPTISHGRDGRVVRRFGPLEDRFIVAKRKLGWSYAKIGAGLNPVRDPTSVRLRLLTLARRAERMMERAKIIAMRAKMNQAIHRGQPIAA